MRLSLLQKSILRQSVLFRKAVVPRAEFSAFYEDNGVAPKPDDRQNAITKSLERLIDKGLLVGYGKRTPEKWFIESVRLTPIGRREAKRCLGEQQRLPLKIQH